MIRHVRALWKWLLAAPRRSQRLVMACACIAVVGMYCSNSDMGGDPDAPRGDGAYRPVLARGDGHMLYLMARSTALDGDWQFDNDLARFGDPWHQATTATGRKSIIHPIGAPLVWTPLIWIAEAGAAAIDAVGGDIELHGYTLWHQRFVFLSSPLFAFGAVLLGRRMARKLVGGSWAPTYAAVAVLFGTSLVYYATYMPSYAHAIDAFACAAFLCYWTETVGRSDVRRWLALGALLGAATLVRTQELAFGVVVAFECIANAARSRSLRGAARWLGGGALALAVTIVVMIPQLLEWQIVFGTMTALPQGARYTRPEAPMLAELLWSARNGWFTTTPLAYLAAIGFGAYAARARDLRAGGLVAALVLQLYLNSIIIDWWGSSAFGQRRLCNVTALLVVGVACVLAIANRWRLRARAKHAVAIAVLGAFAVSNVLIVNHLRGGKAAPTSPTKCGDHMPDLVHDAVAAACARVGSPFELPASAVYALWHGVGLGAWDSTVGDYPVDPPLDDLAGDRIWHQHGKWAIGGGGLQPYIVDGLGAPAGPSGGHRYRTMTATTATVLVPNLMPYRQHDALWVNGSGRTVTLRWNGDQVASRAVTGWTRVEFDLDDPGLHTNELEIDVDAPGALDVSDLEIHLVGP